MAGYYLVEASGNRRGSGKGSSGGRQLVTKPTEVSATKEHASAEPLNVLERTGVRIHRSMDSKIHRSVDAPAPLGT